MLSRVIMRAASAAFAVAAVAAAVGTPLAASAATGGTFRIFQKINGFKVCLDSGFEFSVCQTSPSPDDPPRLEKWAVVSVGNGTVQIENGNQCLDVTMFTAPCTTGDRDQQWIRVSAGNGTVKVENIPATGPRQCLDSMWTFKACTRGDKQQIWTFKHRL